MGSTHWVRIFCVNIYLHKNTSIMDVFLCKAVSSAPSGRAAIGYTARNSTPRLHRNGRVADHHAKTLILDCNP